MLAMFVMSDPVGAPNSNHSERMPKLTLALSIDG